MTFHSANNVVNVSYGLLNFYAIYATIII